MDSKTKKSAELNQVGTLIAKILQQRWGHLRGLDLWRDVNAYKPNELDSKLLRQHMLRTYGYVGLMVFMNVVVMAFMMFTTPGSYIVGWIVSLVSLPVIGTALYIAMILGPIIGFRLTRTENISGRLIWLGVLTVVISFELLVLTVNSTLLGAMIAVTLATSVFVGSAIFGLMSKRNFSSMGGPLFGGLLAVILLSIVNVVFGGMGIFANLLSIVTIVLFVLYTIYDSQMMKFRYLVDLKLNDEMTPEVVAARSNVLALSAALDLYLDFINILLQLLSLFGSKK
jgi:FtsH-binding integral membrane protein